jgi:hypothetical protein
MIQNINGRTDMNYKKNVEQCRDIKMAASRISAEISKIKYILTVQSRVQVTYKYNQTRDLIT